MIILREMPTSATEEEIREIFTWENCPKIKNIYCDVGNFWFVSFEGSNEEVVETLLELRNRKFKGDQDIKARLKTESSSKPISTNYYSGPPVYNSSNSSYDHSGFNKNYGGRPQYYRRSGKYGSSDQYAYRSRYQQTAPYSNGSRDTRYLPHYRRGYRMGGSGHNRDESDKNSKVPVGPPPPLEMESHFPALGAMPSPTSGNITANDGKENKDIASIEVEEVTDGNEETSTPEETKVLKKEVPVVKTLPEERKVTMSGYAAALLKPAPNPPPEKTSGTTSVPSNKNLGKNSRESSNSQKNTNYHYTAKDTKSAGSTTTTATDTADRFSDSSSSTTALDEKSNSSYTTSSLNKDTEKAAGETQPVPIWGGKKSFVFFR